MSIQKPITMLRVRRFCKRLVLLEVDVVDIVFINGVICYNLVQKSAQLPVRLIYPHSYRCRPQLQDDIAIHYLSSPHSMRWYAALDTVITANVNEKTMG